MGVSNVYVVACARLSEKRTSESGSSRISLPDAGEKISDQIGIPSDLWNMNSVKGV